MKPATSLIALPMAAAIAAALVACSSTGSGPGAPNSPRPAVPYTPTTSTPSGSSPTTSQADAAPSDPGAGPGPAQSHSRDRGTPGAPTSEPNPVPSGAKAPYPTPGKDPAMQPDQSSVLDSLPGSSSRSCGRVGDHTDLRAGSIAAGNFQTAQHDFRAGYGKTEGVELNMYVIPQNARHLHEVHATIEPVSGGQVQTVTSTSVEQADVSRYFAVQLPVSRPGTYKLTFATGADHGCFIATFHA